MEFRILIQTSTTGLLLANKPAILIMANGKPPHFFKISLATSINSRGQSSLEQKVLLRNNLRESSSLREFASYIRPSMPTQHEAATLLMRVVVIILLRLLFVGNAHFTCSHAGLLQISSIMMKYLLSSKYSLNELMSCSVSQLSDRLYSLLLI
uniref:Uncharacterized protein n=1 Tax=Arundo donax TaxID=35708 RepID=A0A0A8Z072_ARUDO